MKHGHYHYKLLLLFVCGIILAFALYKSNLLDFFLSHLGMYAYLGAFIAGIFFASTITIATAILMLISLAHYLTPIQISIVAGLGAVVGNYLIFLFINEEITQHIRSFYKTKKRKKYFKKFKPYAHWVIPSLGILILASPFPDEIGILLLSIFNMKTYQFLLLSFVLKFI